MQRPDWADALDAYIERLMDEHQIPGATLAVAERGKTVYAAGYGHRDVAARAKPTPDTIFGIGSITKSFTSLAIMQLADAGKLSPSDPVTRYLSEFRVPLAEHRDRITLHHFMTHTAGLPPLPALHYTIKAGTVFDELEAEEAAKRVAEHGDWPPLRTYADLMGFLGDYPYEMLGAPGTHYSYSNDAYSLLGHVVEQVTGERYEDYVMRRIVEPLGMTRTTFDVAQAKAWGDVTEIYRRDKERNVYHSPNWFEAPAHVPAGFLRSTVLDLNRYMTMYADGGVAVDGTRIVSAAGVAQMTAPHFQRTRENGYGYGLGVHRGYHGVTLVSHGGGIKGVSAYSGFVPERGLAVSLLTNLALLPSETLWLGAVNAYLGLPLDTPRAVWPDYDLPLEQKRRFLGTYKSGEGAKITVDLDGDRLVAVTGEDRLNLRPTGPDTVATSVRGAPAEARFVEDDAGNVKWIFFGGRMIARTG